MKQKFFLRNLFGILLVQVLLFSPVAFAGVEFDGSSNHWVTFGNTDSIEDIFAGGGTVAVWVNPDSDGEGNSGRIFEAPAAWFLLLNNESAGSVKILFRQAFSTTNGDWNTGDTVVTIGVWNLIVIAYDSDSASNDPIFYVNGVTYTMADGLNESQVAAGSAVSGNSEHELLGMNNRSVPVAAFDGTFSEFTLWNTALSASEASKLYSFVKRMPLQVSPSDLVGYWPLDDEADGTSADTDNFLNLAGIVNGTGVGGTARAELALTYQ